MIKDEEYYRWAKLYAPDEFQRLLICAYIEKIKKLEEKISEYEKQFSRIYPALEAARLAMVHLTQVTETR